MDVINIAADHEMFITVTGELSWQRLRRSAVDFYSKKTKKSFFEPPFRGLRGNVRTPSIARWKARGQLCIGHNWTFYFAISYGWDVISGNVSKSAFFERGWVTLSADFGGKGASPTNHCCCPSRRVFALSCGIKISTVQHIYSAPFRFVTIHACDRQTDGRRRRSANGIYQTLPNGGRYRPANNLP